MTLFWTCVVIAFAINWVVFVPSFLARTEKYFDLVGSLTYISVTAIALTGTSERSVRAVVLAVAIWVWAARLGSFLFLRIRAAGHDRRFDKLRGNFLLFLRTWTLQGLWVSATACAAWAAITSESDAPFGVLGWVGLAIWIIGFAIEVVADTQKSRFKADPVNASRFISTGLWSWSRHPNYFGEIVLWLGVAVIALPALDGWWLVTLISPVFVAALLMGVSGVPMLERRGLKRWGSDPDYQQYLDRTSLLILRPPKT